MIQTAEQDKKAQAKMILPVLEEEPGLMQAILDFKLERASGVIEIHFAQGGIAKIFAKPNRTYK